ncbi:MAG: excinuclease ABC subunit UvrC [bacterium]
MPESLEQKVKNLPRKPGIYIYKNAAGKIIYIGKAKSLRNRVSSYFHSGHQDSEKTRRLVAAIRDLDFIITGNELEALLLESTLIKKHRPRYNILLKDDKGYPFLKLTNEPFPRLEFARRAENDGARYFGPYSSVTGVRGTLRFLQRVFPLRFCNKMKEAPCMYFHIEKCPGPCSGLVSPEEYGRHVRAASMFLEGRASDAVKELEAEMKAAARGQQFEKAALLRDRLKALESVANQEQTVVFADKRDRDVVGVAVGERLACAEVMLVRRGLLIGHEPFILEVQPGETAGETLGAFLKLYYDQASSLPREIIASHEIEDHELLEDLLQTRAGRAVKLIVPKRGEKKKMADNAVANAAQRLENESRKENLDREQCRTMSLELTRRLNAAKTIHRIAGFDISTTQGRNTVGSAVSFLDARPDKDGYRKFIIRSGGTDDFSSMREMAARYLRRVSNGQEPTPDLIIVDGGKGQITAVEEGIADAGYEHPILVAGYAKKSGISHIMGEKIPVVFSPEEPAAWLVQRVIAEAHRFAVSFHRKKRGEEMVES